MYRILHPPPSTELDNLDTSSDGNEDSLLLESSTLESNLESSISKNFKSPTQLYFIICVFLTVLNISVAVSRPTASINGTVGPSPVRWESITRKDIPLLRRPSQFIRFDQIRRPSTPSSRQFNNYATFIGQIDKANPHRVLGDYSGQMQMTSLGTVVSEHRTVLMKGGISTVVQFRAMDWGMETCELHISIPRETSNLTISRPNQSISVFQLNTTIVQDGTTLSYNTRPPPFLKLTDLTVDSANGAVWKQEFSCSEEEILTFELACPVTEQTENGCHVEWIQEKSPLDAVIFMRQYATA